ncbi:MAG: DUF3667 domain-containing protein [Ferruginibacter sp.]
MYFAAKIIMEQHTCVNCGNTYHDLFCNHCGQKQQHRYSVKHILHELLHVFTHADKGIFSFAWQLLTRPGHIAQDLVAGKRKKYFNLFQYLIIIVGLATLVVTKTNLMEHTVESVNEMSGMKISGKIAQMQKDLVDILQKYFNILQLLLIPVYTLFSWLYFKKRGYNYAEHIVLNSTISAQLNTLTIANILLFAVLNPNKFSFWYGLISVIILLFCFIVAYRQFFKLSLVKAVLYTLAIYISAYIVQLVLITFSFFIYVMIKR